LWRSLIAIIVARTSLLLSVLGEYLTDPQHGPAGTKQRETACCPAPSGN
jgi:hypothetical protein